MSSGVNKLYEFGSFRLDSDTGTLWCGNDIVSLSPKALDLLTLLIERRGEIVSKQEIFDKVWADTFVEDGVLTQNIYTLRNALGPDENGKQFIETVPRRGYRFAGQFKTVSFGKEVEAANGKHAKVVFAGYDDDELSADLLEENSGESLSRTALRTPFVSTSVSLAGRHSRFRALLFTGLGLLILSAAGFGLYQFALRGGDKTESKIAPIEQLRFQRLTNTGDIIHPTISPNGELLAYVRQEEKGEAVWVQQIATGKAIQTLPTSNKGYRSLAFSPDGTYLYFREQEDRGDVFQTSTLGGTPKKVAENAWSDISVSPDGSLLAFARRDTSRDSHLLILSNVDGSGERELSARQSDAGYRDSAPAWSPDGTTLIVFTSSQHEPRPLLLSIDVGTGQQTELDTPWWWGVTRSLWMPDGKRLIVAARARGEATSQLWMLSLGDGEIRRLTNDLEAYFWVSLSADGRLLVTRQQRINSHLWLLPDGNIKKAKQLTFGERNTDGFRGLGWTPDGKLVFTAVTGHIADVYSIDSDGLNRVALTTNVGHDSTYPIATPDGRYVVFTSNRTGARQIWRMDIDGRNQTQLTFGEPRISAHSAALSPDGKEVFFIKRGAAPAAIWKVSIEGGEAVQVSRLTNATAEDSLSVSPDGRWIAFRYLSARPEVDGESSTTTIGVLPIDGSGEPKLFDLPMRRPIIQWSSDSFALYYSAGTFATSTLMRQPIDGGEPQKVLDFPDRVFNFAWSMDGKNLVVSRGRMQGDAILITDLP